MSITVKIDLYQFYSLFLLPETTLIPPTFPLGVGKTTEKIVYFECADSQPNGLMFGPNLRKDLTLVASNQEKIWKKTQNYYFISCHRIIGGRSNACHGDRNCKEAFVPERLLDGGEFRMNL